MTITSGDLRLNRKRVKKPRWRANLVVALLFFVILATGIGLWRTEGYLWRFPSSTNHSAPRALLVDELALNYPNPSFVTNITQALTEGGYTVDYSGPNSNAVDLFRQLPTLGYDLIIIRAHQGGGQAIITSQPYSRSEYQSDQSAGTLAAAEAAGGPLYFAITPKFVTQDMQGTFTGTTVIVMGCAAFQGTKDLATAFLDKGSNFFVGWDGSVTIIHTDTSTVSLVQQISSGKNIPEATRIAGTADPIYGARLEYLDWNTLVQGRINTLLSQLAIWAAIAIILVFGPLAVFVAPKLFDLLESARNKTSRRRNSDTDSKQSAK